MIKKIFLFGFGGLLSLILLFAVAKEVSDLRYFSDYDPNLPFNAVASMPEEFKEPITVFGVERARNFENVRVEFESRPGEKVPTIMLFPPAVTEPVPCIIFLHGIGQSKEFALEIGAPFTDAGFAFACFDQSMQGERKVGKNPLTVAKAFYDRPWKTVNDARRFIDYLQTRPDIDSSRIYLVGASYGSITGSTLTSMEKRIKASVLCVGGGNVPVLLQAPLIKGEMDKANVPQILQTMAIGFVNYIMGQADPIHYVANTSPTPVLMVNGSEDLLVTPAAGKELFAALGEPKEIRWYPIDHPGLRDGDGPEILRMLDDGLNWLLEKDAPYRKAEGVTASSSESDATPKGAV